MSKNARKRSHCDVLLEILGDGGWHSTAEILERSGGMTVHSRISQLRAGNHIIRTRRVAGAEGAHAYEYRLVSSPPAPALAGALEESEEPCASDSSSAPAVEAGAPVERARTDGEAAQASPFASNSLQLFDPWAIGANRAHDDQPRARRRRVA